jgi:hypothetical protein
MSEPVGLISDFGLAPPAHAGLYSALKKAISADNQRMTPPWPLPRISGATRVASLS